jgi:hypothetical protein
VRGFEQARTTFCRSLTFAAVLIAAGAAAAGLPADHVDDFAGHPRLVVLSDIGNEPDDQMSFVRLLLYSNEIDLEGLVATTSTWQRTVTHAETMREIEDAFGQVRPNLLRHAKGWPTAAALKAITKTGQTGYGLAATGVGKTSEGARQLIAAADRVDPRPLWVTIWGGGNTLAQALIEVRATRTPAEVARFVAKLRVYTISDQDDAGPWMRKEFPDLFYIVSPSTETGDDYDAATWTGISGDLLNHRMIGPDISIVTNDWLDVHIRKGPLGKHYPRIAYIMEGDTPSYLGLTGNGLASWRNPSWGGWGGRYFYRVPKGGKHPIWTQGGGMFSRVTSEDEVTGIDGRSILSDYGTIWRWREAYQHDFAARMDWTIKPYKQANHNSLVVVNGKGGTDPILIDAVVGRPITLDAAGTRDPDGQKLTYRWFHYAEAGAGTGPGLAAVKIEGADTSKATVTPTALCNPVWSLEHADCPATGVAHIILAVTDTGTPSLTSYRRVILNIREAQH